MAVLDGVMQTGVLLVSTAEDDPEDRQLGVRTVIVVLGLARGRTLAVGGLGLAARFLALFLERGRAILLVGLAPVVTARRQLLCPAPQLEEMLEAVARLLHQTRDIRRHSL